jgi:uncharacterized protein YecA (UPF0149 family)
MIPDDLHRFMPALFLRKLEHRTRKRKLPSLNQRVELAIWSGTRTDGPTLWLTPLFPSETRCLKRKTVDEYCTVEVEAMDEKQAQEFVCMLPDEKFRWEEDYGSEDEDDFEVIEAKEIDQI